MRWFRVAERRTAVTWFAVDRPVYVALTLPQESGPTPIQELSDVIAKKLPPRPIDPAPPLASISADGLGVAAQRRPVPRASAVSTMAANSVG